MASTSILNKEDQPRLTPAVRSLLGGLRRRILGYVWLEGISCSIAWLGAAFWASMAIDWFFEPPAFGRGLMLAVAVLGFAWILIRLIAGRTFVGLGDDSMATLLERRFTHLDDSLLTAVVLTRREADPSHAQCDQRMLAHTCRQASQDIGKIRLSEVFNPVPLRQSVLAAVMFAVTVGWFAYQSPDALGTWVRRNLKFSEELWPRKTRLEIEGFDDGVAKVARGADIEIIARADMSKELVPQVVQVRYRTEGGTRGRATMTRLGIVDRGSDSFREYSYTFQGVLAPISFEVVGGDDRLRNLRIEVVESPNLIEMSLDCQFPAYMGRPSRNLPTTPVMRVPFATEITVRCTANKDLVGVQIDTTLGDESLPPRKLQAADLADDRRGFQHTLEFFDQDTTLLFTLSDTDGITSREPVRLSLVTVADEPPQLTAKLQGIGQQITAMARLPVVGRIVDDYGIDKVFFAYTVDQQQPAEHPISLPSGHPAELKLDAIMPVEGLKLTPGQKLLISVKATDCYNLGTQPNIGNSQRWLLDVVTPDELRLALERRELVLRQRFESIITEVTETRELLSRIEFGTSNADKKVDAEPDEEPIEDGAEPGDEPGDKTEADKKDVPSPEQQTALRILRIQRAMQNGRKNAHETGDLAESVDDVRLQFVNNQIDTEELKIRLKQAIADPLHHIADEMFPELQRRLQRLQEAAGLQGGNENLGPRQRDLAWQQADEIRLQMQKVLERMLELEDFNEALELLRAIIELQEELDEQTKQRQKQKLRELLED